MSNARDILIKPIVTEKTSAMMQDNRYAFKVKLTASKIEIKQAVEELFKVKVLSVNTVRCQRKLKRMGKFVGRKSDFKKAFVKIAPGQTIEFFEGV